jgi:23S rRNA (cytidine2498-2'-O)-methyltransferase
MANRRITFVKGDALTWLPPKPVGMLVCDVITSPDKTIGMLRTWLTRRLCSSFCVTIKFKGSPDFEALREIRCLLKEQTSWFDGKQLCHNKNELTVVGRQ